MNCEEFIDALLGEDFPNQVDVSSHMANCPRCASFYEVLKPLEESQSSSQTGEKTVFSYEHSPTHDAVLVASEAATRLRQSKPSPASSKQSSLATLKYAAAFLAGVAASLGGFAVLRSEPIQPASDQRTACLWDTEFDQRQNESEFVRSCVACHVVSR